MHPVADALDATHEELADTARTSILQAVTNAAKLVAKKPGLDVTTVAQLRDLALALVRLCDDGKPQASVTVNADKAQVIVCDERRRAELIQQRERLLALEAGNCKHDGEAIGRETEATQSDANVGTGTGIVVQNQSPVAQPDHVYQRFESVGRAESWKNEPENHAGSFGPWPEEYE